MYLLQPASELVPSFTKPTIYHLFQVVIETCKSTVIALENITYLHKSQAILLSFKNFNLLLHSIVFIPHGNVLLMFQIK